MKKVSYLPKSLLHDSIELPEQIQLRPFQYPFLKSGSKMTVISDGKHLFYKIGNTVYAIYSRETKINIKSTFKRRTQFPTLAMADSFPEHESSFTLVVSYCKLSRYTELESPHRDPDGDANILDGEQHSQMVVFITFAVIISTCCGI